MGMTRRLEGKVAIVAGGGGIGGATATRLAAEGAAVLLGDIDGDAAQRAAATIVADGGRCRAMRYDQSDDGSVAMLIGSAVAAFGRLDGIHVNAADLTAILSDGDAVAIPLDIFDATVAVNMRGALSCAKHALPHLAACRGAFVVTSSSAAHLGEPERVAYAMTKAAVNALVRHIASRWGKDGVRANAIAPRIGPDRPDPDQPVGGVPRAGAGGPSQRTSGQAGGYRRYGGDAVLRGRRLDQRPGDRGGRRRVDAAVAGPACAYPLALPVLGN